MLDVVHNVVFARAAEICWEPAGLILFCFCFTVLDRYEVEFRCFYRDQAATVLGYFSHYPTTAWELFES